MSHDFPPNCVFIRYPQLLPHVRCFLPMTTMLLGRVMPHLVRARDVHLGMPFAVVRMGCHGGAGFVGCPEN